MAATTDWVFVRAFNSSRQKFALPHSLPSTEHSIGSMQTVGSNARVTAVQFPVSSDWFVNEKAWVDFEYFNKSIVRDARIAGLDPFDYNGFWFPKLDLQFDRNTGTIVQSPTRWVAESVNETRFRIVGPAKFNNSNVELIDAGEHWQLEWLSSGLYDDGWTRPGIPARIRLYPTPGQQTARIRTVTFTLRAPADVAQRSATLTARGKTTRIVLTPSSTNGVVQACVPAHGYAEILLNVTGSSTIPGDLATLAQSLQPRRGGGFIASIAEADEIGPTCSAIPTPQD